VVLLPVVVVVVVSRAVRPDRRGSDRLTPLAVNENASDRDSSLPASRTRHFPRR